MPESDDGPQAAAGVDLLRALLEAAPDALVVAALDGRVVLVNAQAERMFGYQREEMLGKMVEMLIPDRFDRHAKHRLEYATNPRVRRTGVGIELQGRRKDGSEFPVEVSLSPIRTADDMLVSSAIRDVTDRKAAERELQDALRRVDEAERATMHGNWQWDVGTNQAIWSKGMYALFGVDPKTFVNSNENFLAMVYPEDRTRLGQAMADALASPGPFLQEYRLIRLDGALRHLRGEGNVVPDATGKARLLYGFVQDVTERKKTEEALRESQEQFKTFFHQSLAPQTITRKRDGILLEANQAFVELTGRRRQDLIGKTASEVGVIVDLESMARMVSTLEQTGAIRDWEFKIQTATGDFRDVLGSAALIRIGGQDCLAVTSLDITERKRAETQLRDLNAFKSHFMSMIAHDLNNVLTPMKLNLALVKMEEDKQDFRSPHLASLAQGIERVEAFLADLLDVVRLQAGRLSINPQLFDLAARLRAIMETQRAVAQEHRVSLTLHAPQSMTLRGDPHRLEQVVSNLLSNALKFTPPGGQILIKLTKNDSEAHLEIQDNGVGIAKEDLPRLFEPFARFGPQAQGKHTGTGLGLFICKGIIEQHGGRVECHSQGPGKGTTFHVSLPWSATLKPTP